MQIKTELYDYQLEAASKGVKRKHLLNSLKTGQGKTLVELYIAADLINRSKIDLVVILTPKKAYLERVWEKEIKKHTDQRSQDLEDYLRYKKLTSKFVFGKHTHVVQNQDLILKLVGSHSTLVIIDEVAAFRNPVSRLTLLTATVLRKAAAVHGLTATPLSRTLDDTYNILNFVRPYCLGSYTSFRDNYCVVEEKVIGRTPNGGLKKIQEAVRFKDQSLFTKVTDSYVIRKESTIFPKFHFPKYTLSDREYNIYRLIAKGISISEPEDETWLQTALKEETKVTDITMTTDITAHSSRFIYLQYAADGIIKDDGKLGKLSSSKHLMLLDLVSKIVEKRQSVLMYFSYYASLQTFEYQLNRMFAGKIRILKSTGKDSLDSNQIDEKMVSKIPHIILSTKAGSESVSYYYINNVIFANCPTVPDTMTQMVGRITRINTLYPDDLNVFIPRCPNVDDYKLLVVSHKTSLMEAVSEAEGNIPDVFKSVKWTSGHLKKYKNELLWHIRK